MAELVNDIEHAEPASLVGTILDKVIGPDVVGIFRPQPHARPIGEPKTASFGLFVRDLQPLPFPDPFDPAVADRPTRLAQEGSDLAIAVAAIAPRQLDHVGRQSFGILTAPRHLALRRAVLPKRRTSAALGNRQLLLDMLDAGAPTRGA